MLTAAQKVDIRRFTGYMAYGVGPSGFQGWRFWQAYGLLEFRMNNMDPTNEEPVVTAKLLNLNTLEPQISAAAANLDTDQAAVWKHNKTEIAERIALFNYWRKDLCDFFGIPLGDALRGMGGRELVV